MQVEVHFLVEVKSTVTLTVGSPFDHASVTLTLRLKRCSNIRLCVCLRDCAERRREEAERKHSYI